jgi:hypothetical protein
MTTELFGLKKIKYSCGKTHENSSLLQKGNLLRIIFYNIHTYMPDAVLLLPLPFATGYAQWRSMVVDIAHGGIKRELAVINLPFLKATGIATAGSSKSRIRMSRAGIKYADAVLAGDLQAEKKLLATCAKKALKPAIRFCELQDPDFEKLFFQLKFLAGIPDAWGEHMDTAEPAQSGICTAIEIMTFAGIIIDRRYICQKKTLQAWRAGFRTCKTTR